MAELIYCGTDKVSDAGTQAMLAGPFAAMWSPPMYRRATPALGDRVWMLWRPSAGAAPHLLGVGRVLAAPNGGIDWTNRTAPGVVAAARGHSYGGPTNMAFLRLGDVAVTDARPAVEGLGEVTIGLAPASAAQVDILQRMLRA
jgi:hypothetical protein